MFRPSPLQVRSCMLTDCRMTYPYHFGFLVQRKYYHHTQNSFCASGGVSGIISLKSYAFIVPTPSHRKHRDHRQPCSDEESGEYHLYKFKRPTVNRMDGLLSDLYDPECPPLNKEKCNK